MNRIFYAMMMVAFGVSVTYDLTDPPVSLTEADRAALVEEVERAGPAVVTSWLLETGEQRGVDILAQISDKSDLDRTALQTAIQQLDDTSSAEEVVSALEEVGGFEFGQLSRIESFGAELFDMAKAAVMNVVLPLIGIMAFFLGLMKVAEEAGVMALLAKVMRPLMVVLFPDVPPNHPAMSAIIMNMAANAAGLGNAATPFGIKAMQELDKLNPVPGTATNAMCLFLAINTSAIALLPTGVISIRAALGSEEPAGIMGTTLIATMMSTTAAIIAAKVYERFSPLPIPAGNGTAASGVVEPTPAGEDPVQMDNAEGLPLWASLAALAALVGCVPVMLVYGNQIGPWLVPGLVVGIMTFGFLRGVAMYEVFVEGAKEGWEIGVRIVPYLVAILSAVGMLRGSGAIDFIVQVLGPYTQVVGLPAEALPLALLRPLSGSGSLGVLMATMQEHGPDSYVGYVVSTMQGSTETTFYTLAVYFGAVQVQRLRHSLAAALTADFVGMVASVAAVAAYFYLNGR